VDVSIREPEALPTAQSSPLPLPSLCLGDTSPRRTAAGFSSCSPSAQPPATASSSLQS